MLSAPYAEPNRLDIALVLRVADRPSEPVSLSSAPAGCAAYLRRWPASAVIESVPDNPTRAAQPRGGGCEGSSRTTRSVDACARAVEFRARPQAICS
jgi:hypothetical protein